MPQNCESRCEESAWLQRVIQMGTPRNTLLRAVTTRQ
jgi:hypothetical protein